MTLATQRLGFEDYLRYEDGSETRYELVNGELVAMSLGVGQHGEIADFLNSEFRTEIQQRGLGWVSKQVIVGVRSPRGGRWDTVRIPDVVVMASEQWQGLQNREAVIDLHEPSPLLVVEIVSESTKNPDYRAKQAEYNVLGIPEYWIVDPLDAKITVLNLVEDWYESLESRGTDPIQSLTFHQWDRTVEQVMRTSL
jgi:Uma2 family endonuclease